jgi:uncharacterized protein YkwD
LALALALHATGQAGDADLAAPSDCFVPADVAELLAHVNRARAAARRCERNELPAARSLTWSDELAASARDQALDMARNDRVSHERADGRTLGERLRARDYRFELAGENVAGGQPSVQRVVDAWLASPPHCAALMERGYREVGVACVRRAGTEHGTHWVMHLGTPRPLP